MARTIQSRKAKGRRFQQQIRDLLLETFNELEQDDVRSTGMGQSGPDLTLSPLAKRTLGITAEMKCQESLSIWSALEQAEKNAESNIPVLFFKRNHSKSYAVIEAKEFVKMLKNSKK